MLKIFRQQMSVELNDTQCRDLGVSLSSRFSPLIAGVKREYWTKVGLPAHPEEVWSVVASGADMPLLAGDLYLVDPDTVLYFKAPRHEPLEAGVITRKDPASYEDFFNQIQASLRGIVSGFAEHWKPVGRDAEGDGSETSMSPSGPEIQAASELENDACRGLLADLVGQSSVFFNKLCETHDKAETERLIDQFDQLGMITRDYAVLCSKTGQQILRVASRAAIEDPSHKNFKCYICGRAINEETVDEIITASDFGRKLLADDHWLLVRVISALGALGLTPDTLRLQRDPDGLVHLSVSINQETYMFVLATHKLTLNDAYLVSAHVAADGVDHVVLVSNQKVSTLMRLHLEKSNPATSFDVVDTLRALEERFEGILKDKEKKSLKRCLEAFATLTPVRLQDLIMQRVAPEPEAPRPEPAPAPAPVAFHIPEPIAVHVPEPEPIHVPIPEPEPEPETVAAPRARRSSRLSMASAPAPVPEPVEEEPVPRISLEALDNALGEEPFYLEEVLPETLGNE